MRYEFIQGKTAIRATETISCLSSIPIKPFGCFRPLILVKLSKNSPKKLNTSWSFIKEINQEICKLTAELNFQESAMTC